MPYKSAKNSAGLLTIFMIPHTLNRKASKHTLAY